MKLQAWVEGSWMHGPMNWATRQITQAIAEVTDDPDPTIWGEQHWPEHDDPEGCLRVKVWAATLPGLATAEALGQLEFHRSHVSSGSVTLVLRPWSQVVDGLRLKVEADEDGRRTTQLNLGEETLTADRRDGAELIALFRDCLRLGAARPNP